MARTWIGVFLCLFGSASAAPISQSPLQGGSGGAPGNLVLLPSSALPATAAAHPGDSYHPEQIYVGYFDPGKCYGLDQARGYFEPLGAAPGRLCTGAWGGNFLNWATTQRLDLLRSVLTGGDRVIDTPGLTVLQKSRSIAVADGFPDRQLPARLAAGATPFAGAALSLRIAGQERSLLLSLSPGFPGEPQDLVTGDALHQGATYRIPIRVQVCATGLPEQNCRRYGNHFKPEGLLQQYAQRLRFSVFARAGVDGNAASDMLRARQAFIGPQRDDGTENPQAEWSAQSGVLLATPRNAPLGHNGVIGYLNRFDEAGMPRGDELGETFYWATRYLSNQFGLRTPTRVADGAVPGASEEDPISHACQRNTLLGIGGPGEARIGDGLSRLAGQDRALNLPEAAHRVGVMEGGATGGASLDFAGLAYDAHVRDLRPDLPGRQSLSTYWLPSGPAEPDSALWLAAKYGGFAVPKGYRYDRESPLPVNWWHDATLSSVARPDTLLDATEPERWRDELQRAFTRAAGSGAGSFGQISAGARAGEVYSTRLDPARWSGDLLFWRGDEAQPAWSAAQRLDELDEAQLAARNILTVRPIEGSTTARQGTPFTWYALDDRQREVLAA
ncbi:hypothetical protein ACLUTX_16630 [Enterobacterales bacterium AE_CKDN230030158-1A_HGKHYDSX7]